MLPALAALSSGLDALQSLLSSQSASTQSTGSSQNASNPFDLTSTASQAGTAPPPIGTPSYQQISPQTMSALIQAQSQSGTQASTASTSTTKDPLQDLFSQLDANGDGSISKSEFENALGAGGTNLAAADKVFGELTRTATAASASMK